MQRNKKHELKKQFGNMGSKTVNFMYIPNMHICILTACRLRRAFFETMVMRNARCWHRTAG